MNRATLRALYRDAILQVFGCGDKKLDAQLIKAVKRDIHLGDKAPGQWCGASAALEIYCENGIPNASDINSFPPMPEFNYKGGTVYNSDSWDRIDGIVNLLLEVTHPGTKVHHEPYNSAVVGIYLN